MIFRIDAEMEKLLVSDDLPRLISFMASTGAAECKDKFGNNPLAIALRHKAYETALYLIQLGTNISEKNSKRKVALKMMYENEPPSLLCHCICFLYGNRGLYTNLGRILSEKSFQNIASTCSKLSAVACKDPNNDKELRLVNKH